MRLVLTCLTATTLLLAAGCGDSSSSSGPSNATFNLIVRGSKMTPTDKLTATKGQTLSLTFTADKDEEIHVHGFDRKFDLKANQPMSQNFPADRTGSFEIEIEDTSTHLGELDVNPS